eukprot:GHVP01031353.1.p1 GENE.GHVP01031353.1~~GHVP01031353.1.p1  ORF type:complete len:867 (+),score=185.56 GHVP01031353.1:516-3116(+)
MTENIPSSKSSGVIWNVLIFTCPLWYMIRDWNMSKVDYLHTMGLLGNSETTEKQKKEYLTNILFYLNLGKVLTEKDATELFFVVVKHLQNKDPKTCKLVILIIKSIARKTKDSIMAISSLMQIISGSSRPGTKADAVRTLCVVSSSDMIDNTLKVLSQTLSEKDDDILEATLMSFIHLTVDDKESTRKFHLVIQNILPQVSKGLHIGLWALYLLKSGENMFQKRLLQGLDKYKYISPLAACIIIRIIKEMNNSDMQEQKKIVKEYIKYRDGYEIPTLEAIRVFMNFDLEKVDVIQIKKSLSGLLETKDVVRQYSTLRTLSKLSFYEPKECAEFNERLVGLLDSENSQVSSAAFGVLLQTGDDKTIDALLGRVSKSLEGFTEELRMEILTFLDILIRKNPQKTDAVFDFFVVLLRSSETSDLAKKIVESIYLIMKEQEEKKDLALESLCSYAEDCSYPEVLEKILWVLGEEGASSGIVVKIVRTLYNRILLEGLNVRRASALALFKIASKKENIRESSLIFLTEMSGSEEYELEREIEVYIYELNKGDSSIINRKDIPDLDILEERLNNYINGGEKGSLDIESIKRVPIEELFIQSKKMKMATTVEEPEVCIQKQMPFDLNTPFVSTDPEVISSDKEDVSVSVVKHIFTDKVLLEFICENTFNGQIIKDISMDLEYSEDLINILDEKGIEKLCFETPESCYYLVEGDFKNFDIDLTPEIKMTVFESDDGLESISTDFGMSEKYNLADMQIGFSDFVVIPKEDIYWDMFNDENEFHEKVILGDISSLSEAEEQLILYFNGKKEIIPTKENPFQGKVDIVFSVTGTTVWNEKFICVFGLSKQKNGTKVELQGRCDGSRDLSERLMGLIS